MKTKMEEETVTFARRYDVGDVDGFIVPLGSGFAWSLERAGMVLAGGVVRTLAEAEVFMEVKAW